ncbi:MAG: aminotransferase, partial [Rhizonema sp. PD38]|nr:aminotransferase [Rhizonema sp. PD38]
VLENRNFMSIHDDLFDRFGIEVPVVPWQETPRLLVRVSAQIYNNLEQYEYLAKALMKLVAENVD